MHTTHAKKNKNVITLTITARPQQGHNSQKPARFQDRRTARCRTRNTQNRAALAGW